MSVKNKSTKKAFSFATPRRIAQTADKIEFTNVADITYSRPSDVKNCFICLLLLVFINKQSKIFKVIE